MRSHLVLELPLVSARNVAHTTFTSSSFGSGGNGDVTVLLDPLELIHTTTGIDFFCFR